MFDSCMHSPVSSSLALCYADVALKLCCPFENSFMVIEVEFIELSRQYYLVQPGLPTL